MATSGSYAITTSEVATAGPLMSEIIAEARMFLDELVEGRFDDSHATQFDMINAAREAYVEYSREVKCFKFSSATTIDSTAETATYAHTTFDATGRLFEITAAAYNEVNLAIKTVDYLDNLDAGWRFRSSSTPTILVPWGEGSFRLWPTPSGADHIFVEGYQTADLTTFAATTDTAAIHSSRGRTLAAYMASLLAIRLAGIPEAQVQQSACYSIWLDGIKQAKRDVHGSPIQVVGSRRQSIGPLGTGAAITGS